MKTIEVHFIKDGNGKVWREYVSTDKRNLITDFIRHWFSLLDKIDAYDAQQTWRLFEKNGWSIVSTTLDKFPE